MLVVEPFIKMTWLLIVFLDFPAIHGIYSGLIYQSCKSIVLNIIENGDPFLSEKNIPLTLSVHSFGFDLLRYAVLLSPFVIYISSPI
jgi:hypothetical protein